MSYEPRPTINWRWLELRAAFAICKIQTCELKSVHKVGNDHILKFDFFFIYNEGKDCLTKNTGTETQISKRENVTDGINLLTTSDSRLMSEFIASNSTPSMMIFFKYTRIFKYILRVESERVWTCYAGRGIQ